jgi:hypothetical protein
MSAAYPFGYPPQSEREKLEPAAIFGLAKPAIAFVAAEVTSQASDSTRQSLGKEEFFLRQVRGPMGNDFTRRISTSIVGSTMSQLMTFST